MCLILHMDNHILICGSNIFAITPGIGTYRVVASKRKRILGIMVILGKVEKIGCGIGNVLIRRGQQCIDA
ncbi:uncharacterized protein Bfra_010661 [Botrytis fragariae]|uniref:Uncharacterized protein n=1 Tax=Botrytis fragariae TaxID=1964551 RepID=A0A8H6ECT1_9HELO|nr:uncharacterized protein Bfra_010661 [Botrytis fragariae]KAF5867692.1 hypothetical protein Bfra_010661 [Botrytis fragariae]